MIDASQFDLSRLVKTLLRDGANELHWREECEIIEDANKRILIRHVPSGHYLRYSCGPRAGHLWDSYGDNYQSPELAFLALLDASPPFWYAQMHRAAH